MGLRPVESSCPSDVWGFLHAPLACEDVLTLVDVGANKGLLLASWVALFAPGAGVDTPEDLERVRAVLVEIQHQLFNLGGELSIPGFELLKEEAVLALDQALAEFNAGLPALLEFILPAGTRAAALAHVCRTVARRAERAVVALGNEEALKERPRQYLNRLSDLLFVLARVLNRHRTDGSSGDDVYWKSERVAKG